MITTVVILAYVFWPIPEELSTLAAAGNPSNAPILRENWGVPHIFGTTDADAAYGLAHAHTEDDFDHFLLAI